MRIAQYNIWIDGQKIEGVTSYEEDEKTLADVVKLIDGTDWKELVPQNSFSIEVTPKAGIALSKWADILNGNVQVSVKLKNSQTLVYNNCKLLSLKNSALDGTNELKTMLKILAGSMNIK